jgi:eukaryotic-like serine/threonine-protein kinase
MGDKPSKKALEHVAETTLRSERPRGGSSVSGERAATTAPGEASGDIFNVEPMSSSTRFRNDGEIARGGMGTVCRVYDTLLRREVAMKISDPSSPSYAQTALRFMEEAQITGQLDHPNIVPVHDLGSGVDRASGVFFTMKLVEGETLTKIIERAHGAEYDDREVERILQMFLKICDALSFAHSRGVVHRDLKPDNVMVGSHGQVYVMDWGVALISAAAPPPGLPAEAPLVSLSDDLSRDSREEAGAIVGTFEYMAPEQAWGRTDEIDHRTDVFGLGSILYHLLTGRGPNAANTAFESLQRAQRALADAPESRGAWPNLPPGLCRISLKALSKRQDDRYQTVVEMRDDIEDFLRGGGWFETSTFPSGHVIVRQGDAADAAYIITEGTCEVLKAAGNESLVVRRLGPGEVFGETAVLTGEPRTASVVAVDRVTVKVVTRDALERELGQKSWASTFVKALAQRFRDVDEQLSRLRDQNKSSQT